MAGGNGEEAGTGIDAASARPAAGSPNQRLPTPLILPNALEVLDKCSRIIVSMIRQRCAFFARTAQLSPDDYLPTHVTASRSIGLVTAIEGLFMTWV